MRTSITRPMQSLLLAPVLFIAFTTSNCTKLEPAPPSSCQETTDLGAAKRDGDVFIKVTNGAAVQEFKFCASGLKLKTGASGELWYDCDGSNPPQVGLSDGKVREMANETYVNRAYPTSGPVGRKTLYFTFPAGYNECSLNPPTRFNYDAVTGSWSLAGAANGVVWYQATTPC